jgi:hypothetical protein
VVAAGCGSPAEPSGSGSTTPGGTSTPAEGTDSPYPDSIVVLGHSGATGANSDDEGWDVRANSWATGTNPEVDSIYLRVLALNPAVEGNNTNLAQDGSNVDDLLGQAESAFEIEPRPELFLIQSVDNDTHCELDADSLETYGATLSSVLEMITTGAPDATIFIVSSPPGTVQNYADVIKEVPAAWYALAGAEPCDLFDESGALLPEHVAAQEAEFKAYFVKIAEVCAQFPACGVDGGAAHNMVIDIDDLSSDFAHLSVMGHQKFAATTWDALY